MKKQLVYATADIHLPIALGGGKGTIIAYCTKVSEEDVTMPKIEGLNNTLDSLDVEFIEEDIKSSGATDGEIPIRFGDSIYDFKWFILGTQNQAKLSLSIRVDGLTKEEFDQYFQDINLGYFNGKLKDYGLHFKVDTLNRVKNLDADEMLVGLGIDEDTQTLDDEYRLAIAEDLGFAGEMDLFLYLGDTETEVSFSDDDEKIDFYINQNGSTRAIQVNQNETEACCWN